jgi:hypothetical protein
MSLQKQGLSSDLDERGLRLEDLRDVDTDQRPDKKLNLARGAPIHPYRSQASAVCYCFFIIHCQYNIKVNRVRYSRKETYLTSLFFVVIKLANTVYCKWQKFDGITF